MPIKRKSIKEIVAAKKKQDEKDLKNKFAAERRTKGEYPPLISTMLKRLKRIDPWMGAIAMNKYDAILIFFFKLKQRDISPLRIAKNNKHMWVEFTYDEKWWIFDPYAVKNLDYGDPVKQRIDATEEIYTMMTQYYTSIDDFMDRYSEDITISKDEARILAMKDENLSSVLQIKYH
jgi:hypothetical protein